MPSLKSVVLFFLAIVFSIALMFAFIELPVWTDAFLSEYVGFPGFDQGVDSTSAFKTNIYIDALHLRWIGYISLLLVVLFIVVWRFFYMLILNRGVFNQKIILLGSGELARNIEQEILQKKDSGYKITVKIQKKRNNTDCDVIAEPACIIKEDYDGLCEIAQELNIRKIIIAITEKRGAFPIRELLKCRVKGIEILEGIHTESPGGA